MSEVQRYPVPADLAATAQINAERYEALYAESIEDPEGFFDRQARSQLTWMSDQWDRVSEVNMARGEVKWFAGGTLNACVNCIDRHLPARASQTQRCELCSLIDDPSGTCTGMLAQRDRLGGLVDSVIVRQS